MATIYIISIGLFFPMEVRLYLHAQNHIYTPKTTLHTLYNIQQVLYYIFESEELFQVKVVG